MTALSCRCRSATSRKPRSCARFELLGTVVAAKVGTELALDGVLAPSLVRDGAQVQRRVD